MLLISGLLLELRLFRNSGDLAVPGVFSWCKMHFPLFLSMTFTNRTNLTRLSLSNGRTMPSLRKQTLDAFFSCSGYLPTWILLWTEVTSVFTASILSGETGAWRCVKAPPRFEVPKHLQHVLCIARLQCASLQKTSKKRSKGDCVRNCLLQIGCKSLLWKIPRRAWLIPFCRRQRGSILAGKTVQPASL